jgi:polyisoprenoid-binding protein YceI
MIIAQLLISLLAQAGSYAFAPGSSIAIEGSSTAHHWRCRTASIGATLTLDPSDPAIPRELVARIPVSAIECENSTMTDDMRAAMHARRDPFITYRLVEAQRVAGPGIMLRATGDLSVAGVTRRVSFDVHVVQEHAGSLRGQASVPLRMSDFGVKPPSRFGVLRTADAVTVKLDVRVTPAPNAGSASAAR